MIDNKIMYEIIEKLHESFSASISICDVSGRVIVSTDSSCMGEMNLLAIEALNINSKVTVSMDSKIQKAGAAMPLRFRKAGWAPWFSRAQVPPAPSWLNC